MLTSTFHLNRDANSQPNLPQLGKTQALTKPPKVHPLFFEPVGLTQVRQHNSIPSIEESPQRPSLTLPSARLSQVSKTSQGVESKRKRPVLQQVEPISAKRPSNKTLILPQRRSVAAEQAPHKKNKGDEPRAAALAPTQDDITHLPAVQQAASSSSARPPQSTAEVDGSPQAAPTTSTSVLEQGMGSLSLE